MRVGTVLVVLALGVAHGGPVLAQGPSVSDAECQSLRQRLGEHARLSDGVRKAVATQAEAAPAATTARGLARGTIFSRSGKLVCSVAQEVLLRTKS